MLDVSSIDKWRYKLNIPDIHDFHELISYVMLDGFHKGYLDSIWMVLENHIDFYTMPEEVFDRLSIMVDELSHELYSIVCNYVGPDNFNSYEYRTMLQPYGAVFERI